MMKLPAERFPTERQLILWISAALVVGGWALMIF